MLTAKIEKWEDQENEIVQYGRNMSSMAYLSVFIYWRGATWKNFQDFNSTSFAAEV